MSDGFYIMLLFLLLFLLLFFAFNMLLSLPIAAAVFTFVLLLTFVKSIEIFDEEGHYASTKFYYKDDKVYYNNNALGNCVHDDFTKNPNLFEKHVNTMLSNGLQLKIEETEKTIDDILKRYELTDTNELFNYIEWLKESKEALQEIVDHINKLHELATFINS